MRTPKKASTKAQAFCSKLRGSELPKSTSWAQCTDIINEYFPYVYDMRTNCKAGGDNTVIKIYKGDESATNDDLLETFSIPNSEIFFEKEGDWDWPTVYKIIVEYFMKNWKTLTKGKKVKKKPSPPQKVDINELMGRVEDLRIAIRSAKGPEKKKLIVEFNEKSVLLEKLSAENRAAVDAQREANKLSEDEIQELKRLKQSLMHKIYNWGKQEKDTTELREELLRVTNKLKSAKTGVKS